MTFKIDSTLLRLLDRYARSKRMTRSEVIREAIVRLLESEGVRVREVLARERASEREARGLVIEVDVTA